MVPAAGVPLRVAVPSPLSVKVTPVGRLPVAVIVVAVGYPAAVVTAKVPDVPIANVVPSSLVMAGSSVTVRVKSWVASVVAPLPAVMVIGKDPLAVGVPAIVAVPSPLSVKLTPPGRAPVLVIVVAVG